jgi:cobalt-zinc-cadmium efflux system protein
MGLHHHHHHHDHSHEAGHHHHGSRAHSGILLAFVLNLSFAVIELIGGYMTDSVAVMSDALHDFGDAMSLAAALILERLAQKQANARFSYGYRRLSLLSAGLTSAVLVVGTAIIMRETLSRFSDPGQPHGLGMMGLAILGIGVNGFAAWRLKHGSTMNERVLSWHMIEDLLGWILVLIGGGAIHLAGLSIIDPILSMVFSLFIIYGVVRAFRETMGLFLQAVPAQLPIPEIKSMLGQIEGLCSIHDLHVWSLDGEKHVVTLHAVVDQGRDLSFAEEMKKRIRDVLSGFGDFHATIEIESDGIDCSKLHCADTPSASHSHEH